MTDRKRGRSGAGAGMPVLLAAFLLLTAAVPQSPALGQVSCHCFRDRSFEPSRPASADPYIMATVRNSLLAAAAGMDKGAVVRQRMTGASEADLWLSYYLSTIVDRTAQDLLEARGRESSWAEAFDALGLDTGGLGPAFQRSRKAASEDGMARALADPVLARTFGAGGPTLARLGDEGADIAQAALSLFLGGRSGRPPEKVLQDVLSGGNTWGSLLNSLGMRVDTIGDVIGEKVRRQESQVPNLKSQILMTSQKVINAPRAGRPDQWLAL